jgi:hypothetical protein
MLVALQVTGIIAVVMLVTCACNLMNAVATHRKSQAASVLHHAGLLQAADEEGDA